MVFSDAEHEQFIEDGLVVLRRGFDREVAAEGRAFLWREIGVSPDPATWKTNIVHVQKNFMGPPFDRIFNPRLREAFDELMGAGRGILHETFGWWPVLFPGFPGPGGWHVDGYFQHHLDSPEQGMVTLYLFSNIGPGDGGTPVVRGSHRAVARLLAEAEPAGLSAAELAAKLPEPDSTQIVFVEGEAGDVAMLHPFSIHGFGPNTGQNVRFACNPQYPLRERMLFDRADGNYSPVEEAIRRAIR
jgi:hypothetical protein